MTPTELLDGVTQMAKRLEDAEAKVARLAAELHETGAALAASEAQVAGQKINLEIEIKRANDAHAALNMYANAWTRELGSFYPPKMHEIDALVGGTRRLREEGEKMMRDLDAERAQAMADHRALNHALGRFHEIGGKKLPAPSPVIAEIIAKLNSIAPKELAECGDTQGTSSFGPVRCRLPRGHDGEHVDNVTAAQTLPGARTVWPRK